MFFHRVIRNVFRRFGGHGNLAGVFVGKKSLGNDDEQKDRQDQNHKRKHQRGETMAQSKLQRAVVAITHPVKKPLEDVVNFAVLFSFFRMHKTAAHHRRKRQRNKTGRQNRDDNGHGKFVQQPSEQSAHEQNRNENRRKRKRHGNDGEADFLRAFERCLHWRLAHFHVAHDIFEHDNRVVHHKAHAKRQRHERKIVEAVIEQRHDGERADDAHRQRQAGNDGGGQIAQKNKNHQHDEADGEEQSAFHIVHGFANGLRTVEQ